MGKQQNKIVHEIALEHKGEIARMEALHSLGSGKPPAEIDSLMHDLEKIVENNIREVGGKIDRELERKIGLQSYLEFVEQTYHQGREPRRRYNVGVD